MAAWVACAIYVALSTSLFGHVLGGRPLPGIPVKLVLLLHVGMQLGVVLSVTLALVLGDWRLRRATIRRLDR